MLKIGGQKIPFQTLILVVSESILIVLALLGATFSRFLHSGWSLSGFASLNTVVRFAAVIIVCEVCLYYYDLYDLQLVSRRAIMFVRLLQALGAACLGLALLYYLQPGLSLGRGVAVLAAPSIVLMVLGWRLLVDSSMPFLRRPERILVLGVGASGIKLVKEIVSRPEYNLKVVGFLDQNPANIGKPLVNPGIIGTISEVEQFVVQQKADRVVISLSERRGCMPIRELLHLKFAGVHVQDAHALYETLTGRILLEHLNPSSLILSDGFRKSPVTLAIKRAMDLTIAILALIVTSPIVLLISVAIWLESGSPVLFRQKRVGLRGREFEMLKFRSMYTDPQNSRQASWTGDRDRRITRVGKFIRRYRIDELPQMINVLLGDMSVVGPRPEQPYFCELLEQEISYYGQRHCLRPGITGWAQVKYQYGASVEETRVKLEHDLFYVKHLSFMLDIAIILETLKVLVSGRGSK